MSSHSRHLDRMMRILQVRALRSRTGRNGAGRSAASPSLARLALLGAAVAIGCADQPDPHCIATTLPFALKLVRSDVVESTPGACDAFRDTFVVEPRIGLWPYYQSDTEGQPDYDLGALAIQTADLGSLVYTAQGFGLDNTASDGQLYSYGSFASPEPDGQNFCSVPELSPTRVVLPEVAPVSDDPATPDTDESFPGQGPVDSTITWSNVRVYVTAATFGTQMDADFTDTRIAPTGESCAISYRALGLAPAVRCAATDADGNEIVNADGTYQVDEDICNPEPDLAAGRPTGSGIAPNVRYECDPVTAYCLIEGDSVPALR
jgi:hypothetical protein